MRIPARCQNAQIGLVSRESSAGSPPRLMFDPHDHMPKTLAPKQVCTHQTRQGHAAIPALIASTIRIEKAQQGWKGE